MNRVQCRPFHVCTCSVRFRFVVLIRAQTLCFSVCVRPVFVMCGGAVCYVPCSCMDRHLNSEAAIRSHAFNANEPIENLDQTQHYYKKIFVLIVVRLRAIGWFNKSLAYANQTHLCADSIVSVLLIRSTQFVIDVAVSLLPVCISFKLASKSRRLIKCVRSALSSFTLAKTKSA